MIEVQDVKQLIAKADVLSLFLHVDPGERVNQAKTPAWRIWLKNALRDIEKNLDDEVARQTWDRIQGHLDDYLDSYSPRSKTLVLFIGEDFEQVHELPVVLENRIAYGKPLVAPLLWAIDEYEPYLIVLVDRDRARFVSASLGRASRTDEMRIDLDDYDWGEKQLMLAFSAAAGGQVAQGSKRDQFNTMLDAHVRRFHEQVVDRARELARKMNARRIILGGSEKAAHAVREMMGERSDPCVVAIVPIPFHLGDDRVLERILPVATEYERQQETALVDELIGLAKAGGSAALGREEVLKALEQQRIDLLVAPWPLPDTIDSQLPLQVLEAGSDITLVHGAAAEKLNAEGGMVARLYYAL